MHYRDLREFIAALEQRNQLKKIDEPIAVYLEMTEISDRVLRQQGPALLFKNPIDRQGNKYPQPVLSLIHI